jgi:hypothetical protein
MKIFMQPFLIVGLLVFAAGTALAQDPVQVAPDKYKVLLENDRIRVLEFQDKPSDKEGMHSHPDYVVYVVSDFKRKFTEPDGNTREAEGKAGQVLWRGTESHSGENIGTTATHVILIELKE